MSQAKVIPPNHRFVAADRNEVSSLGRGIACYGTLVDLVFTSSEERETAISATSFTNF
jgi:hypothetical protein